MRALRLGLSRTCIALAALAASALSSAAFAQDWRSVVDPFGRFAISFPAEPQVEAEPAAGGDARPIAAFVARFGRDIYSLQVIDLGDGVFRRETPDRAQAIARGPVVRREIAGFHLVDERAVTRNGWTGYAISGEAPIGRTGRPRTAELRREVFVIGNRLYDLRVALSGQSDGADTADRFFGSFQVLEWRCRLEEARDAPVTRCGRQPGAT